MKAQEVEPEGRDCGDGVGGSVKRPVRYVEGITGVSELGSVELFGRSASPNCHLQLR
jgi:hypothetical protein